jgi:hypothetical protein
MLGGASDIVGFGFVKTHLSRNCCWPRLGNTGTHDRPNVGCQLVGLEYSRVGGGTQPSYLGPRLSFGGLSGAAHGPVTYEWPPFLAEWSTDKPLLSEAIQAVRTFDDNDLSPPILAN